MTFGATRRIFQVYVVANFISTCRLWRWTAFSDLTPIPAPKKPPKKRTHYIHKNPTSPEKPSHAHARRCLHKTKFLKNIPRQNPHMWERHRPTPHANSLKPVSSFTARKYSEPSSPPFLSQSYLVAW